MKKWQKAGLVLGLMAWALVLLQVAVPVWNDWRNEQLLQSVQEEKVRTASFWLDIGADPNVGVYMDFRPTNLLNEPQIYSLLPVGDRFSAPQPLLFVVLGSKPESRVKILSALLDHGANLHASTREQFPKIFAQAALEQAINERDVDMMRFLLDHGANPNQKMYGTDTLLFCAVRSENHLLLRLLLQHKVKFVPDVFGATALHRAAECNDAQAVRMLLNYGAKIDERDQNKRTALMYALRCNQGYEGLGESTRWTSPLQMETVKLLLAHGADPNARDNNGKTPLMYAALADTKLMDLLISHGASPKACDRDGRTVLHFALDETLTQCYWNTNVQMVSWLQKRGASLMVKDKNGKTPAGLLKHNQKASAEWKKTVKKKTDENQ